MNAINIMSVAEMNEIFHGVPINSFPNPDYLMFRRSECNKIRRRFRDDTDRVKLNRLSCSKSLIISEKKEGLVLRRISSLPNVVSEKNFFFVLFNK